MAKLQAAAASAVAAKARHEHLVLRILSPFCPFKLRSGVHFNCCGFDTDTDSDPDTDADADLYQLWDAPVADLNWRSLLTDSRCLG